MKNKEMLKVFGILACVGGLLVVMFPGEVDGLFGSNTFDAASGSTGMHMAVQKQPSALVFEPGSTHKWKLSVTNTGSVTWDDSWFTVQLGTAGTTVVEVNAVDYGAAAGIGGMFSCAGEPIDSINCKEKIYEVWDIQKTNGVCPDNWADRTVTFETGALAPGATKIVEIQLTLPIDTGDGDRYLLVNSVARTSVTTVIGYVTHIIDPGCVSGVVIMQYLGLALTIGGALMFMRL